MRNGSFCIFLALRSGNKAQTPVPIVGIWASAGGFEAFVKDSPSDEGSHADIAQKSRVNGISLGRINGFNRN
jgi:hypothetical protein